MTRRAARLSGVLLWLLALAVASPLGCASNGKGIEPQAGQVAGMLAAEADTRAELVRADPVAYLHAVAVKCSGLAQYQLTFTRHERRGLFNMLKGPERISCWFRREPFSIRMKWLDPDVKYGESVYIEGQYDNKVRFVPRHGAFGLKPSVTAVDLQTPVIWGEAKRPLTDFGLERLLERTLVPIAEAGEEVVVTYMGLLVLPQSGQVVHHIHLEYPDWRYRVSMQELYVDVKTDLPAGTVLKLSSGLIDAAYFYEEIRTDVSLTNDDFVMDFEREEAVAAGAAAEDVE
ncbi:MAG: DUF1571 domain-containing protein [Planctomycetes bacterium]|nr:DUF1571 domain-containing protein [Planctomycetota bacterium]